MKLNILDIINIILFIILIILIINKINNFENFIIICGAQCNNNHECEQKFKCNLEKNTCCRNV